MVHDIVQRCAFKVGCVVHTQHRSILHCVSKKIVAESNQIMLRFFYHSGQSAFLFDRDFIESSLSFECCPGTIALFCLPDMSLLFMPSRIPHRVRPTKTKDMCTRINVTLRSIPSPALDPDNSLRGVSNHVRYYQCPREIILAQDKETTDHVTKIMDAFNACLTKHSYPPLQVRRTVIKKERVREKKILTDILRKAYKDDYKAEFPKLAGNVTSELLQAVAEKLAK